MTTAQNKNKLIGEWLQGLLIDLKDKNDTKAFKKVLLGYDEQKIKSFGDGVLATTYVTRTDYQKTFGIHNRPVYIHSVVAFVIKGTSESKYNRAVSLLDLLQENFETNKDWKKLETPVRVVRDTDVLNSYLRLAPINKKLSIIGFFELRHHVYK